MKIVFYSTTTAVNIHDTPYHYPRAAELFEKALAPYLDKNEFVLVTSDFGCKFIVDVDDKGEPGVEAKGLKYIYTHDDTTAEEIAQLIIDEKPDLVVEMALPTYPFDWTYLREAVIAEMVRKEGFKVEALPTFTAIALFDKWRSQKLFRHTNCRVSEGIYVNSNLYWADRSISTLCQNSYRDYVNYRIKGLTYPLIVKSTIGAGSAGVHVVNTYDEAIKAIGEIDTSMDFMAEELIEGEQFGTEIHETPEGYDVLPPFRFSMTEEGITDPLQSMKFGPVDDERYHVDALQEELRRLAEVIHLKGIAQVDLVFKDDTWYVIEVNPRWSGLSALATAAENRNPVQVYVDSIFGTKANYSSMDNLCYVFTFKTLDVSLEALKEFSKEEPVKSILSTEITGAEEGGGLSTLQYSDVVLGGFESKEAILEKLEEWKHTYPAIVSDGIIAGAKKLVF